MKPRSELEAEYRKLAKRADARLRQIEASSRKPEFRAIKKYAYNAAMEDIRRHYGGGKRFVLTAIDNTIFLHKETVGVCRSTLQS